MAEERAVRHAGALRDDRRRRVVEAELDESRARGRDEALAGADAAGLEDGHGRRGTKRKVSSHSLSFGPRFATLRGVKGTALAVALVVSVLTGGLASGTAHAQPRGFDPDAVYAVPLADSERRGPDDALLTIVEFSDFGCRFCVRAQHTLEQVERLYPGQVRWVFRHFPLDEDEGTLAAEAAVAAANQGRFWPMHDRLFAVRGQVDRAAVELYAAELGLDLTRFRHDLDSGAAKKVVLRDWQDGVR
ncbi:MAG: thioredoxin domain-containing protein, partial [Kofleriaceae bacterium]